MGGRAIHFSINHALGNRSEIIQGHLRQVIMPQPEPLNTSSMTRVTSRIVGKYPTDRLQSQWKQSHLRAGCRHCLVLDHLSSKNQFHTW